MSAVTGTNFSPFNFETPAGYQKETSGNLQIESCFVSIGNITGTYVQGTGFSFAGVAAAIQAQRRDARTVTLLAAAPATLGTESGSLIGAKNVTVTSTDINGLLTTGDFSTEHANGAMGSIDQPLALYVLFKS